MRRNAPIPGMRAALQPDCVGDPSIKPATDRESPDAMSHSQNAVPIPDEPRKWRFTMRSKDYNVNVHFDDGTAEPYLVHTQHPLSALRMACNHFEKVWTDEKLLSVRSVTVVLPGGSL